MLQKIISVSVAIAILTFVLLKFPQYFPFLVLIVSVGYIYEWCKMIRLDFAETIAFSLATIFLGWVAYSQESVYVLAVLWALTALHCVIASYVIYRFEKQAYYNIHKVYLGLVGVLLIATFANSAILLYYRGIGNLLYIVAMVSISDSIIYLIDRRIGKYKIAPRINTNRTYGGVIGGLVSVVLLFFITIIFQLHWGIFILETVAPYELLIISLLSIIISTIGNLFINMINKQNKVRNSGIMLGNGVVLYSLGTLLTAIPIFLLLHYITLSYIH